MEKLRRIATGENKSKHDFSDPVYDKVGEKALGHFVVKYFGAVLRSLGRFCFHFYYNLLRLWRIIVAYFFFMETITFEIFLYHF